MKSRQNHQNAKASVFLLSSSSCHSCLFTSVSFFMFVSFRACAPRHQEYDDYPFYLPNVFSCWRTISSHHPLLSSASTLGFFGYCKLCVFFILVTFLLTLNHHTLEMFMISKRKILVELIVGDFGSISHIHHNTTASATIIHNSHMPCISYKNNIIIITSKPARKQHKSSFKSTRADGAVVEGDEMCGI